MPINTTQRNQSAERFVAQRQQMEQETTDLIEAVLAEIEAGGWSDFVTRPEMMEEARNHWQGWMVDEDVARRLYGALRERHPRVVERKRKQVRVFCGVQWRDAE